MSIDGRVRPLNPLIFITRDRLKIQKHVCDVASDLITDILGRCGGKDIATRLRRINNPTTRIIRGKEAEDCSPFHFEEFDEEIHEGILGQLNGINPEAILDEDGYKGLPPISHEEKERFRRVGLNILDKGKKGDFEAIFGKPRRR